MPEGHFLQDGDIDEPQHLLPETPTPTRQSGPPRPTGASRTALWVRWPGPWAISPAVSPRAERGGRVRPMARPGIVFIGVLLLAGSLAAGCNRTPAVESLAEAESSRQLVDFVVGLFDDLDVLLDAFHDRGERVGGGVELLDVLLEIEFAGHRRLHVEEDPRIDAVEETIPFAVVDEEP